MNKAIELLKEVVGLCPRVMEICKEYTSDAILIRDGLDQALAELEKQPEPGKEKIKLLKDYIAVVQGRMSQMFFCKRHNVSYQEFEKIAYVIGADLETENKQPKPTEFTKKIRQWIEKFDYCHNTNPEIGHLAIAVEGSCDIIDQQAADYADLKEVQQTDYEHAVSNCEIVNELSAENKRLKEKLKIYILENRALKGERT